MVSGTFTFTVSVQQIVSNSSTRLYLHFYSYLLLNVFRSYRIDVHIYWYLTCLRSFSRFKSLSFSPLLASWLSSLMI